MSVLANPITSSDLLHFGTYSSIKSYLGPNNFTKGLTITSSDRLHAVPYANTRSYYSANNSTKSLTISIDALTDRTVINPNQAYVIL